MLEREGGMRQQFRMIFPPKDACMRRFTAPPLGHGLPALLSHGRTRGRLSDDRSKRAEHAIR